MLNYLPFQILDRAHISSCTSAGSVLQLCKVSKKSNKPLRRSCAYKVNMRDNSTYTFTKRGACSFLAQLFLNDLLDLYETLHICSTLPADVHEGIWLLSKIWKGDNSTYTFTKRGSINPVSATPPKRLIGFL
jgi:hypothetical protein